MAADVSGFEPVPPGHVAKKTHACETQVAHRVEHFGDINERW